MVLSRDSHQKDRKKSACYLNSGKLMFYLYRFLNDAPMPLEGREFQRVEQVEQWWQQWLQWQQRQQRLEKVK
jgi:hypothetical protein